MAWVDMISSGSSSQMSFVPGCNRHHPRRNYPCTAKENFLNLGSVYHDRTELGGCCVYGKNQPPLFWQVLTTWWPQKIPIQCKLIHTKEFCEKINGEVARFWGSMCDFARLKTNTEKNPILYVWNIVCSAKLPSWFCVFAKSILPNRWVYIPQSTSTLQQLTKLPTPVCQNCEVHIANSPSPHHLWWTARMHFKAAPTSSKQALFHVYSICAAVKKA